MTLAPTLNWLRAKSWVETDAVIEKASGSPSRDRESHKVDVEFSYRHHDTRHVGTRRSLASNPTYSEKQEMEDALQRLSAEKQVTCWVNPADPREAVLDRSLPQQVWVGLFFSTPFVIVGGIGPAILALPWLRRRYFARRKAQLTGLVRAGRLPEWALRPFAVGSIAHENDVALTISADERLPQALGVTMLALFWNSLVAMGVCADVSAIASGDTSTGWLLSLFLTPFVAVGIAAFWITVKLWRLTYRPGWVAALRPVPDFEGGAVDFCWAWMDSRHASPPQAVVRIVAQAASWDEESGRPTRIIGRKRRTKLSDPAASRQGELELAAVDVPILNAAREMHLHLPSVPSPRSELAGKSRWPAVKAWGGWWQLEVTYRDGAIEIPDLTKAEKFA